MIRLLGQVTEFSVSRVLLKHASLGVGSTREVLGHSPAWRGSPSGKLSLGQEQNLARWSMSVLVKERTWKAVERLSA